MEENKAEERKQSAELDRTTQNAAGVTAQQKKQTDAERKKEETEKKKKRAAAKAYRDRYFAYYDDVKTKVSEDW